MIYTNGKFFPRAGEFRKLLTTDYPDGTDKT